VGAQGPGVGYRLSSARAEEARRPTRPKGEAHRHSFPRAFVSEAISCLCATKKKGCFWAYKIEDEKVKPKKQEGINSDFFYNAHPKTSTFIFGFVCVFK